jgi:NAD(P)-dependent dehydrogenase (short-subunit alcohol dehydrogenase family)
MPNKYTNKLDGKLVLILGGTSGIGFAVAEACIEHGADVVVSSRSQENIDKAVAALRASYPDAANRISGHACNLSQADPEPSITALFDHITSSSHAKVDHVITTAGESGMAPLATSTAASLIQNHSDRLVGTLLLAKVAQRYLAPSSASSFTLTSGVLTYRPLKGMSATLVAVGAKEALVRGLAVDLAPVRVNVVSPGAIQTPLLDSATQVMGGREAGRAVFRKWSLLDEVGTPEDCAEAYLCAVKSGFMTGTVIHVEGGALLKSPV